MKNLIFVCLAVFLASCCKPESNNVISACLEDKLEAFKLEPDAVAIKTQTVNGEKHYWLNTNATHHDGVEYILGENCDTVCSFCGECIPAPCSDDYDFNSWEIYWEK